jgi:hypothetical protein
VHQGGVRCFCERQAVGYNRGMRYRLRTLLIFLAIGPPLIAAALVGGDRRWLEFRRWLARREPNSVKGQLAAPVKAGDLRSGVSR